MTSPRADTLKRARGRPRTFDRDAALAAAMKLFWERGYEGAYFKDLIAAMKIGHAQFTGEFGSKAQLYRDAVAHYLKGAGDFAAPVLAAHRDAREAVAALVDAAALAFTRDDHPAGCMVFLAGAQNSPALGALAADMRRARTLLEKTLADRLAQGVAAGDLPADTDIAELAAFFETLLRGMAAKARDGASRENLATIGRAAMRAWPAR